MNSLSLSHIITLLCSLLIGQMCLSQNVGINESAPSETLDVNGNIEMNGALKGTGRVYTTNDTEVTYTSSAWVSNSSVDLPAGTWMIWVSYEAKGWAIGQDFMQYRLRDVTQNTNLFGTGLADWLYLYYVTSDNFSNDYWFPITQNKIYVVPSGTSTIDLQFYGNYDVKIKNVSIMTLRIE